MAGKQQRAAMKFARDEKRNKNGAGTPQNYLNSETTVSN